MSTSSVQFVYLTILTLQLIIVSLHSATTDQSDSIGFPENIEDESKRPLDDRQALFMPTKCKKNELLYPGDQQNDWVCDCRPAYLYYPDEQGCFAAFEEGPCEYGRLLQMPEEGFVPVCVENTCKDKQKVRYKGLLDGKMTITCVKLGRPCNKNTRKVFGVNATTLKVECLEPQDDPRFAIPTSAPSTSTTTKKPQQQQQVSGRPYVVNPRFGQEDEASEQNIIPIAERPLLIDPKLIRYFGTRLAVDMKVCFPGCRRILENKCQAIVDS